MFGNLGVHIIEYPSGKFGFVGTLPAALGSPEIATLYDIMAGRAETNPYTGVAMTLKFPSFDTKAEAEAFLAKGVR